MGIVKLTQMIGKIQKTQMLVGPLKKTKEMRYFARSEMTNPCPLVMKTDIQTKLQTCVGLVKDSNGFSLSIMMQLFKD